ncbi:MAG: translocation/assembly module TamB domain-containing protein [Gemmatimonadales bacterium]
MSRRRLVVMISAIAMLLLGVGTVGSLVLATQSEGGRDWIRRTLARELSRGMKGKLHLGRLSGSFLTDITIDSLAITDPDDSLFIALGPLRLTYDPRDILDGRIIVRSTELQNFMVVFRKENDQRWNYRKVFPPGEEGAPAPPLARRAFGALVVFHNVRLLHGHVQLTTPWEPDDTLRGAQRDSAIAVNLKDPLDEVRRVVTRGKPGFQHTMRWTRLNLVLNRLRFRHPDSTGRQFDIARWDVSESSPPLAFRNLRGNVLWRGDSIWADFRHFDLPASTGRATGEVNWADNRPIQWNFRVVGDSVALKDIAWVSPTLPRTGGGVMRLHIHNERDLRVMDYAITEMDVRTNGSRLRGAMTFGSGGPVLVMKDFNLQLLPADLTLFETLNGGKFDLPWRGTLTGTVRARGGPVNHFQLDEASVLFADRNVPGATAKAVAKGELDLLYPARVKFHGVHLELAQFDLRTAQFVSKDFPRLNGDLSGTATLDSIWTDVRLRDADFTHRDGDSTPASHFKGNGRITLGADAIRFDLAMAALPLSATTLARSFPGVPFRGEYSGPLRVRGQVAGLSVTGDLVGDAGRLQLEGQFDADGPHYGALVRGSVSGLDLSRALARAGAPVTAINGRFAVDLQGDSLANLSGSANVAADRSVVDSVRVYSAQALLKFDRGLMRVDSLRAESVLGLLTATGGLGLVGTRNDSLRFRVVVDSLGGLRKYLASRRALADSVTSPAVAAAADSLDGTIIGTGTIAGSLRRFALQADITGSDLRVGTTTVRALTAGARLSALPDSATGVASLILDTLRAGGVALARVAARADLLGGWHATATVTAEAPRGALARVNADVRLRGDTTVLRVDSLALEGSGNAWSLRHPMTVTTAGGGFVLDSLTLEGARGGRLGASGRVPADGAIAIGLRAEAVPLTDLGELVQSQAPLSGTMSLRGEVRGTRARPDLSFSGELRKGTFAGLTLDGLTVDGRYANRRLTTSLDLTRSGVHALHADATLPVDLAWRPAGSRLLEDPLSGRVRTDSVGLVLFEALSRVVSGASGGLAVDLDLAGTWRHPWITGQLTAHQGALSLTPLGSVKLRGIEADIGFLGDSVAVRRLAARTASSPSMAEIAQGFVGIRDIQNPTFHLPLTLQSFNVMDRKNFADLDVTGSVLLDGAFKSATLRGSLTVDRGVIYVPELYQKRVISLDDPEFYRIVDTSAFVERRLLPEAPPVFMDNLFVQSVPVQMGRDVWLRSKEANINLGGLVNITRGRVQRGSNAGQVQLALVGTLQTVRGTYRLNLGPVQTPFQVENGDVRFYGDPDLNATLNINALHTVRQFSQQNPRPDVRVRVHLGGTLLAPTAELSSPDSLRVTNADLISYLVTGGPSYAVGGRSGDPGSAAANVLLASFGSVVGGRVTGGLCDDAELSTAGLDTYAGGLRGASANILSGTRFNCAKQLSEKMFVRADFGLCQVAQAIGGTSSSDPLSWADAIGVKLDLRMRNDVTLSGGMDPSTSALLCRSDASARGFAPTPRQFGLDLFKFWRF